MALEDRFGLVRNTNDGSNDQPSVDLADGIVAVAEAALAAGAAAHPGVDRYQIHLHLHHPPQPGPSASASEAETATDPAATDTATTDPGPDTGPDSGSGPGRVSEPVLALHLGPVLPTALRHLLTCDTTLRPIHHVDGIPVSVGRRTRVISTRIRRLVEHRDHGCVVPGCDRTVGIEVHHITHWEHGGPTDTANLVTLCRRHHRLHHTGHLHISGNPEIPPDAPGALTIADPSHRPLRPGPTPTSCSDQRSAANQLDLHPCAYTHPLGERLDHRSVHLAPNPQPPPPNDQAPPSTGPAPPRAGPGPSAG